MNNETYTETTTDQMDDAMRCGITFELIYRPDVGKIGGFEVVAKRGKEHLVNNIAESLDGAMTLVLDQLAPKGSEPKGLYS